MSAPGRTSEVVTTRNAPRRAALAAGAALVLAISTTANPSTPQPVEAAPTPLAAVPYPVHPVLVTSARDALTDRVERAVSPPATRSTVRAKPRLKPRAKPRVRHKPAVQRAERRAEPPQARRAAQIKPRRVQARTTPVRRTSAVRPGRAGAVLSFGRSQIGDPYRFGATGPRAWDCSGLTQRAFAAAGIRLPRQARAQSAAGTRVSRRAARAGDLVLWGGVGSAHHIGIYAGGGMVLHSPRSGQRVKVAPLWGRPQFRRVLR